MNIENMLSRGRHFVTEDIWRFRKSDFSGRRFALIRFARILILSVREFIADGCKEKASALTYYSLMSIVPLIAMAFGVAKGFGFESVLQEQIEKNLYGHEEMAGYLIDFADTYLSSIKGGLIAGVGFGLLLWTVMNLLGHTEQSFNSIWKAKRSRSLIRKFSDYISIMLIGILFLVSSGSAVVYVSNMFSSNDLLKHVWVVVTAISPFVLTWFVFTMLFFIMPNTKVKFGAAMSGGIVSGTIFLLVQFFYIYFQVGMSKYNAIYGSFAAIPLFLIWLQLSWYIVLFGAEVAYAVQNVKIYEFDAEVHNISDFSRKANLLCIATYIVRRFAAEQPAENASQISENLHIPLSLVNDLLFEMSEAGLISEVRASEADTFCYQPSFDINVLTVSRFLEQIEKSGATIGNEAGSACIPFYGLLDKYQSVCKDLPENRLLKDL